MGKHFAIAALGLLTIGSASVVADEVVVGAAAAAPALLPVPTASRRAKPVLHAETSAEHETSLSLFEPPHSVAPGEDVPSDAVEGPTDEDAPLLLARPAAVVAPLASVPRFIESTWYTRFEYMNLSYRGHTGDTGPLYTLGYRRRVGHERFRAEFFGSQVHNDTHLVFGSLGESTGAAANYLGGRIEYDLLFEPVSTPRLVFFGGVGSRFWLRQQSPRMIGQYLVEESYRQDIATFYPYLGIENRHDPNRAVEFFGRGRIGLLAVTFEAFDTQLGMFRNPGVTGQVEMGWRGENLFLSGYFEAFSWPRSPQLYRGYLASALMLTVGLQTGYTF